jgi:hypothetical protein
MNMSCKDPRDRVFALLGCARPVFEQQMTPDYDHDLATVYAAATCASFQETRTLRFFFLVDFREEQVQGLPTWAVDFTCTEPNLDLDEEFEESDRLPNRFSPTTLRCYPEVSRIGIIAQPIDKVFSIFTAPKPQNSLRSSDPAWERIEEEFFARVEQDMRSRTEQSPYIAISKRNPRVATKARQIFSHL